MACWRSEVCSVLGSAGSNLVHGHPGMSQSIMLASPEWCRCLCPQVRQRSATATTLGGQIRPEQGEIQPGHVPDVQAVDQHRDDGVGDLVDLGAYMVDLETLGDRSYQQFIHEPVGPSGLPLNVDTAIA